MKTQRTPPENLSKRGFNMSESDGRLSTVALLSLRSGLRSYSATYAAMRGLLRGYHDPWVHPEAPEDAPRTERARRHSLHYAELCFSTVVHLHNFAEITLKELLATAHPLLVISKIDDKHDLLYKLATGARVSDAEMATLQWTEFSTTLSRTLELIKTGRLSSDQYGFIADAAGALKSLNELRNRLLHRGRFLPLYDALDDLVGGHLIQFAFHATAHPLFSVGRHLWYPPKLECGVDPLKEIPDSFSSSEFDLGRVAFFKELTRAAYENELGILRIVGDAPHVAAQAESAAAGISDGVYEVRKCLVCGLRTLVVHEDSDTEVDDFGKTVQHWWKTFMVECEYCGFHVRTDLQNPKDYGVEWQDFWELKTWR